MTLGFGRAASLSFLGMAAMSILTVHAQVTITTANGLWNSGVESDNVTLIPGNSNGQNNPADPHYTETYYIDGQAVQSLPPATYSSSSFGTATTTGQAYVAFPAASSSIAGESWIATTSNSQWITYQADMGTVTNQAGSVFQTPSTAVTVYQLVLTGIPAGRLITIGGEVASDDNVTIYGNGSFLFSNFAGNDNGTNNAANYNSLTPLANLKFTSVAGSDDLDFVVYNNGGYPTGLNVQLTGTYQAVPEPSTYALLLGGFGLLAFWRSRARRTACVKI